MPGGGSLNPSSHETVDKKMHYIHQDGQTVYKFAVRKMLEATTKVLERNGVTGAELGCFIPHQANMRIITATADRLGMARERVIINIDKYGNTSAGTIPLAMETAVEEGKLKKGDLVLLAAAGAGFYDGSGAAAVGDIEAAELAKGSGVGGSERRASHAPPWVNRALTRLMGLSRGTLMTLLTLSLSTNPANRVVPNRKEIPIVKGSSTLQGLPILG